MAPPTFILVAWLLDTASNYGVVSRRMLFESRWYYYYLVNALSFSSDTCSSLSKLVGLYMDWSLDVHARSFQAHVVFCKRTQCDELLDAPSVSSSSCSYSFSAAPNLVVAGSLSLQIMEGIPNALCDWVRCQHRHLQPVVAAQYAHSHHSSKPRLTRIK